MSKLGNKKNSKDAKQKQMAQQLAALAKKNEKKKTGKQSIGLVLKIQETMLLTGAFEGNDASECFFDIEHTIEFLLRERRMNQWM